MVWACLGPASWQPLGGPKFSSVSKNLQDNVRMSECQLKLCKGGGMQQNTRASPPESGFRKTKSTFGSYTQGGPAALLPGRRG